MGHNNQITIELMGRLANIQENASCMLDNLDRMVFKYNILHAPALENLKLDLGHANEELSNLYFRHTRYKSPNLIFELQKDKIKLERFLKTSIEGFTHVEAQLSSYLSVISGFYVGFDQVYQNKKSIAESAGRTYNISLKNAEEKIRSWKERQQQYDSLSEQGSVYRQNLEDLLKENKKNIEDGALNLEYQKVNFLLADAVYKTLLIGNSLISLSLESSDSILTGIIELNTLYKQHLSNIDKIIPASVIIESAKRVEDYSYAVSYLANCNKSLSNMFPLRLKEWMLELNEGLSRMCNR